MPLLLVVRFYFVMKYNDFKKARKFGKDEANKGLLGKIGECEDMLGVLEWLKSNENKDKEGNPRYSATVSVNIHGRGEDDSNEKGLRTISYDTNFDFVERKVRENYDRLIKEFEERSE